MYLPGRFLHEAEVEANQKQTEMDKATDAQKGGGHRSKSKERKRQRNSNMVPRQIPASSSCHKKRARQKLENVLPDAFIQAYSRHSYHSYYRLVLTRKLFCRGATIQSKLTPDETSALHR